MTRSALLLIAFALGGCLDCTIEAHVTSFFDEHDAIDCKFAHQFLGEREVVGATIVRDCITDAIVRRKAFVGGYVLGGIDSQSTYAYLGTARGDATLLVEEVFYGRHLFSKQCTRLVPTGVFDNIGLDCIGDDELEPVCDSD